MLQKKCKKCLEAENFPLKDLLFYILEVLGPYKAELVQEGIIFLIHLFARAILLMKKLKIEETKAT